MSQYLDESALEPIAEPFTQTHQPAYEEVKSLSDELPCEGAANSHLPLWQPEQPQFTKAIAQYYGVSRKSVQQWYAKITDACPWLAEPELKLPDGRYTPTCIELMGDYRLSGLPIEAWKASVWERNQDKVAQYLKSQPHTPEVLPPETTQAGIVPYERSSALNQILQTRPIPPNALTSPEQNPVFLMLQQKISQMQQQSEQAREQLGHLEQAHSDTQAALDVLEDLEVVEKARAKAERHYSLEKTVYREHLDSLKTGLALGKQPMPTSPGSGS